MTYPLSEFIINDNKIIAWDSISRVETEEKGEEWYTERNYGSLINYFTEELGASLPKNVCALAVDLAKINNIKMSELFQKYQEQNKEGEINNEIDKSENKWYL